MRPGAKRAVLVLLALASMAGARAARADDSPRAPAAAPVSSGAAKEGEASAGRAGQPRVHASHRVEVIAPGERVETIVDRMRADRPASPVVEGGVSTSPGVRAPDRRELRTAPDRPQGPGPSMPGPGGGGMPAPRGDAPPPDRPRR